MTTVSAGHALKTHSKWITGEKDKRYINTPGSYEGDYTIHGTRKKAAG